MTPYVSPHSYEISDELFNQILKVRDEDNVSIEGLSKSFNVGSDKIRKKFAERGLKISRVSKLK
jgi:hypothetical protein